MARIMIEDFGGMVPIREDRLLPENMAAEAVNVDLESGVLSPVTLPARIHQFLTTARRGVRIPDPANPGQNIWLGFVSPYARFYPGPLVNDVYDRHIWLDNNAPGTPQRVVQNSMERIRSGLPPYLLGVPAPTVAPGLTVSGGATPVISRAYVYTIVNVFGEESQPSPAVIVAGNISGVWALTGFAIPDGIDPVERGISKYRIYRTITGASGTLFYRVDEVNYPVSGYNDNRDDAVVAGRGVLLESTPWREPEDMEGIIALPGGFFAGWKGRTVFFSEPYRSWAWPAEYVLSTNYDIIAAGVVDTTLILFTTSRPVMMSGTRPENMQIVESNSAEPCFSPNSVVSLPEGVYFAGRTGLFLITGSSFVNVTRDLIRQTEWQRDYQSAGLSVARVNDTQIVALSDQGFGFVLDLSNSRTALIRLSNLEIIDSMWNDPYTGEVHVLSSGFVYQWQYPGAPNAIGKWISKEFHLARPVNFGAMALSMPWNADDIASFDPIPSFIIAANDPVNSGPWLDQCAVFNYTLINGTEINAGQPETALPPTTIPPGNNVSTWPLWFGMVLSAIAPDLDLTLPDGAKARVTIRADGRIVFSGLITDEKQRRLPSGYKADVYQVEIVTRVPVMRFVIAETGKELESV